MKDPVTVTIHVQGSVLSDAAMVQLIVERVQGVIPSKDIRIERAEEVGYIFSHARQAWQLWQPRAHQRRQRPATFAGPDKRACRGGRRTTDVQCDQRLTQRRQGIYSAEYYGGLRRSAWRGGRRSGDLHRERRFFMPRRSAVANPMFWLHRCAVANRVDNGFVTYLHSRYCPDCGTERTTFYDRRTGAAERRAA